MNHDDDDDDDDDDADDDDDGDCFLHAGKLMLVFLPLCDRVHFSGGYYDHVVLFNLGLVVNGWKIVDATLNNIKSINQSVLR